MAKGYNPCIIRPGLRRAEIRIVSIGVQDQSGEFSGGGIDVIPPQFAAVTTPSTREGFQSNQFSDQATHIFEIPWPGNVGITNGMKVLFAGKVLDIIAPPEDVNARGRVLKLTCLETNTGAA
jgi:SPP1 family predicted phage head-tail adaptor